MRGNRLGAALMGGDGGDAKRPAGGQRDARASRALECRWFPDPRTFQSHSLAALTRTTTANSPRKEIDAMPEGIRIRIRQAIDERLGGGE